MKQIILFRHGKSSWDAPCSNDVDRPLMEKGKNRTRKMAKYLLDQKVEVDLLVTSHAVRAFQTASIIAEALNIGDHQFTTNRSLYHASVDKIWDLVFSLPEDADKIMLFGHNPGFTEFINKSGIERIDWLPTSGAASLSYDCTHWHECIKGIPRKNFVVWPAII